MVQVKIVSDLCSTTRDIPLQWSWKQLTSKLYEYTGVTPQDMKLTFIFSDGPSMEICRASWSSEKLSETIKFTLESIEVIDNNENSVANRLAQELNGGTKDDATFELSEEAYEQRTNSVLSWKKRLQVGKFDPEYVSNVERERRVQALHAEQLAMNERCSVITTNCPERRGWLRFIGIVPQINEIDIWCGIEFDEPVGKNDGTFAGQTYFGPTRPNYGGFVKPTSVKTSPDLVPLFDEDEFLSSDEI